MRAVLALGLLTALAACTSDPRAFGITGPGPQPAPVGPTADSTDSAPTPGMSTSGSMYGPTNRPSTGASGFWGYN
jgi:hypothetical protein